MRLHQGNECRCVSIPAFEPFTLGIVVSSAPSTVGPDGISPKRFSVIVADDAHEVRIALGQLIDGDPRFEFVGGAVDADEAVTLAAAERPDLAVVDVRMPGGGGVEACRRILEVSPHTTVVALSAFASPTLRKRMAEAGATGYLTKDATADELLDRLAEIVTAART